MLRRGLLRLCILASFSLALALGSVNDADARLPDDEDPTSESTAASRGVLLGPSAQAGAPMREAVSGELIVQFDPSSSKASRMMALAASGASLKRHMQLPGFALAKVPGGHEEEFALRLRKNPLV